MGRARPGGGYEATRIHCACRRSRSGVAARGARATATLNRLFERANRRGLHHIVAAFKQGLNETGFVEGQNLTIEYKWADQHFDRLPELAADLVNEVVPRGKIIGYLFAPNFDFGDAGRREVETAARRIGRDIRIVEVSKEADLEKAFASVAELHVGGVLVAAGSLFSNLRDHLLA